MHIPVGVAGSLMFPDGGSGIIGEVITGDQVQRIQNIVQRTFLMPDSAGAVEGLPENFAVFIQQRKASANSGGGGATRRMMRMTTQETTTWVLYATAFAAQFLREAGCFE